MLDDPSYDLVVLDTPPTSDALDFLDAPERLIEALDSPAMRWLVDAFEPAPALGLSALARGVAGSCAAWAGSPAAAFSSTWPSSSPS